MNAPLGKRVGPYQIVLPKCGRMRVAADVFVSKDVPVEPEALRQLVDAASLPGVARVLATPDIHVGFGVPIGAVVAADDFVSPAAVGYDINCGMRMITTPWAADSVDVAALARGVREVIPLGEGKSNVRLSSKALGRTLAEGIPGLLRSLRDDPRDVSLSGGLQNLDLEEELEALERVEQQGSLSGAPGTLPGRALERGAPQLGTLGGGNHFIEFQRVVQVHDPACALRWGLKEDQLVLMIHSGSRGLGHEVGGHYMHLAKNYDREHGIEVPSGSLAILPLASGPGRDYLGAMNAAANYAFANREMIALLVKRLIRRRMGPAELRTVYDVAHNLAVFESHEGRKLMIHRKGATRAFPASRMARTPFADLGQPVLVPGSMGTASWLLRGIPEGEVALFSTNHGAGRVMSRTAAAGRGRGKRRRTSEQGRISDQEFRESMAGVFLLCEDPRTIKEEAPAAYKDIDAVIDTVVGAKLASAVARMVPLAVLKG